MISILYQDDRLLAVRKPPGIHVHPSDLAVGEVSLQELLLSQLESQGLKPNLYPVHRLDRATSGVLLFAFDAEAASYLGKAFQNHEVQKTYHGIIRGWLTEEIRVEKIVKAEKGVGKDGLGITTFRPMELWELPLAWHGFPSFRLSLVQILPITGRRHQIRQHCDHLLHPILGDTSYGDTRLNIYLRETVNLDRLCLFCRQMIIPHPDTGKPLILTDQPDETEKMLFCRLTNKCL